jgi:hypothetical protein
LPDHPADSNILDNHRVHARPNDGLEILPGVVQLRFKHQCVESDVALDAPVVEISHEFRQVGFGKVPGPHPRVKPVQTEINGVRAVLNRRPGAFPVARGRQKFREPARGRDGGGICGSGRSGMDCAARVHAEKWPGWVDIGVNRTRKPGVRTEASPRNRNMGCDWMWVRPTGPRVGRRKGRSGGALGLTVELK